MDGVNTIMVYESVIGLEVHCQLLTASKAFSPDSAEFGAAPNQHVDPVSLGLPGTLPVLNAKVIAHAVRLGLAMNCEISERSILARKHYFYPDLPKGYQISQFEQPICAAGHLDIEAGRRIGITRIHIEEDAGKSLHDQDPVHTLLDYNRCGVPLLEIVSEPDLRSGAEANRYMQKIRQLVRYLEISDGNMEEGSLRCDANVSVRPKGTQTLGTKTEIKNMNSFRHVERAIDYEVQRQVALLRRGESVTHETRLWDDTSAETFPMRSKEEAHDYRYFPDPDLPPVLVTEAAKAAIEEEMPRLPDERYHDYVHTLQLPEYDAQVLTDERPVADYFEQALEVLQSSESDYSLPDRAKALSNFIMGDVLRTCKEKEVRMADFPIQPERLARLAHLRMDATIGSSAAQSLFEAMITDDRPPEVIARERNLIQVSDRSVLHPVVDLVLKENPKQVALYLRGKESIIGFFIGQVMRRFDGAPDPKLVHTLVKEELTRRRS